MEIGERETVLQLFGPRDVYLKRLRRAFQVALSARGGRLRIDGPEENVRRCGAALEAMGQELGRGHVITEKLVEGLIKAQGPGEEAEAESLQKAGLWPGVTARTPGQAVYVEALLESDVVICVGPAGTGKTFLGVAVALGSLNAGQVNRIVLCRPAVEAGENLGFLPGDIYEKVNPYLRPLYDALHELMDVRRVRRYIENDIIEILPLAFMRGRTLDNAFIILDEAQNCTVPQMKTFLTRLGPRARLLVTGDITQTDLPPDQESGLADAVKRLRGIPGLRCVYLSEKDIIRHALVGRILEAYDGKPPRHPEPGGPGDAS